MVLGNTNRQEQGQQGSPNLLQILSALTQVSAEFRRRPFSACVSLQRGLLVRHAIPPWHVDAVGERLQHQSPSPGTKHSPKLARNI